MLFQKQSRIFLRGAEVLLRGAIASLATPLLRRQNKATVILKLGRFYNLASAVISNRSKAVQFSVLYCFAYTLMMTAESLLSKRPVLTIAVALFFLFALFSSHLFCI